ncbi:hypothetical protein TraAM80_03398 [Trypanosoma rangeli]|uniref:Uncharacterized protein n=1 Tax=Trypanosoma rangeli TaxID=5698 RepID=A0A422NP78_TRYRA|nr:uncharacterized protein TraAM80_03398 [Trypanosoma rangeli]RNF07275.1 hypothetical protein TraAM80_03398 [Trypanosoma rangeli]|eukprot:RNF07275.1 hypothetical protein TraAM80_03398 [Trypanosoma rangeli]
MDLLLLLCGLCPLLECSGVRNATPRLQEAGLIVYVSTEYCETQGTSQGFLKRSLKVLDIVLVFLAQDVARVELQNCQVSCVVLEMLTWSGTTNVLKNAQILLHLILCGLLNGEKGAWYCDSKLDMISEGHNQKPLVNYFLFDQRIHFRDILTTRLSMSIFSSVHLRGFEKASVQEVIVVLEALVNGNILEHVKQRYL